MANDFDELLKIQRMIQERTKKEVDQDRMIELMALIGRLVPEGRKVQLEHIYVVAAQKGFTELQVNDVLRKYIHDRIMYQPQVGYIQRE